MAKPRSKRPRRDRDEIERALRRYDDPELRGIVAREYARAAEQRAGFMTIARHHA